MRKLKITELNRLTTQEFKNTQKHPVVAVLDNIRSLNNVGSIFRTSDAFKLESLFLCGITATPPHNDIHKTALGAEDAVTWQYFEKTEEAVKLLKANGYITIAVEQVDTSVPLTDFVPDSHKKYALILGNEVKGVQQSVIDLCDMSLEIPQFGTKHSLNVSVSAGIVIWETVKHLIQK
ncbi:RNA methyltransferase [Geofilum sp. OHC36d9]|uniref:RNA methyltransferase n=1 Tax=Geofilum sp. OHC36d9 TaxID=3458413 RepID=UPI004034614C